MTADLLREAASKMRERAEAAVLSPWLAQEGASGQWWVEHPSTADIALDLHRENAEHIASWHPAVALAVADLLENEASLIASVDEYAHLHMPLNQARVDKLLAIARAYLGGDS